jgi:hypothetical protein
MKPSLPCRKSRFWIAVLGSLLLALSARAYPPAPFHVIYGVVRDDYGTPLMSSQVQVVLETPTGVQLATRISSGLAPGVNYRLEVPMDSGITADIYQPTALIIAAQFKIYVVIGQVTNVPVQMTGSFSALGQPARQTRIDLTLGVDSNGDGIPDSWELAYLAALGSNLTLPQLSANRVIGPSGLTVMQEFLAGYYPYDPADTFVLRLVSVSGGSPVLEFTGITGHSYSVLGSSDLRTWIPLSFRLPSEGPNGPQHAFYSASAVGTVQMQALQPNGTALPALGFSRNGNQLVFSWPTNAVSFTLTTATSLTSPVWTPVVVAPFVVNDQYVVTNSITPANQFYRLSRPAVQFFRLMLQ